MSQQDKLSGEPSARFDPQSLMAAPIGLSTPLFLAFYSAASVGAAFWWMSQLTRYTHLEAKMAEASPAPEPAPSEPIVILACELEVEPEAASEAEVLIEAQEVIVAAPEAIEVPAAPKPAAKPRARKAKATA
jgi:hypothetical protein